MKTRSAAERRETDLGRVHAGAARVGLGGILVVLLGASWSCTPGTEPEEQAAIAAHVAWQEERLAELRAEDGWFAVGHGPAVARPNELGPMPPGAS